MTIEEIEKLVQDSVGKKKIISLKTYLLSDYGESMLKVIVNNILEKFNRIDLMEMVYSSAKELIINATKANLKRVIFYNLNLEPSKEEDYHQGMAFFKNNISEEKILSYKAYFKKYNVPVVATFYYNSYVLNIKVKNSFPLLDIEERRIRDKFQKATSFSSLLDFFMEYGDDTEGAGMGLTMVGILLDQSGIDKRSFSLYSSKKYNETVAKLEIPLDKEYIPKRKLFDIVLEGESLMPDELR
ncbi:MAG: hypothetical protein KDK90_23680, partial [Leptospiraceae bacterium]|nr:hypothetical protein [Leptospiraceae bacterium]